MLRYLLVPTSIDAAVIAAAARIVAIVTKGAVRGIVGGRGRCDHVEGIFSGRWRCGGVGVVWREVWVRNEGSCGGGRVWFLVGWIVEVHGMDGTLVYVPVNEIRHLQEYQSVSRRLHSRAWSVLPTVAL